MPIRLGDYVRFRAGKAPEAMKGRERDVGLVMHLVTETGPEPWPVVQFDDYRSAVLQPGMVEVVRGGGGGGAGSGPRRSRDS